MLTGLETDRNKLDGRGGHNIIQDRFTKFADWGNISEELKKTFHKLRDERVPARYLKGKNEMYVIDEKEAQDLYVNVGRLIDEAEREIK